MFPALGFNFAYMYSHIFYFLILGFMNSDSNIKIPVFSLFPVCIDHIERKSA